MTQTSYSLSMGRGLEGQLNDSGPHDIITMELPAAVPFGVGVTRGAAEGEAVVPDATGEVSTKGLFLGVTVHTHAVECSASGVPSYPAKSVASIIKKGRVLVKVEEAVNAGDQAFCRFASGAGGTQLGAFRKSADTATAVAVPGAYFYKGAASGGLAVLDLNLNG